MKETPEHLENKLSRLLSRYAKEPTRKKKTAPEPEEIAVSDKDEYRDLVRTLQNKYKDFNASFPIFIRWTVQTGEYSPNALRSFLRKHAQTRLKSMEDFLQLQVNYVKYIFMEKNKHYNTDRLHRLAEDLMRALLKEEKEFKDVSKEVEADMEKYKKEQIEDMRRRIREHLLATKS